MVSSCAARYATAAASSFVRFAGGAAMMNAGSSAGAWEKAKDTSPSLRSAAFFAFRLSFSSVDSLCLAACRSALRAALRIAFRAAFLSAFAEAWRGVAEADI
eukprot:4335326-Prymnesium_polylepis.2